MGKLSDITARASNTGKRQSSNPKGYRPLKSIQKENIIEPESPNFMSPTISSSRQSSSPRPNSQNSPVPPNPVKADSNAWMKGAAKRVGVPRRTSGGDGMPRSRKESLKMRQPKKAISFPDKVCSRSSYVMTIVLTHRQLGTSSRNNSSASPPPLPLPVKISPKDKPLPSPPVILLDPSSPKRESKTLIDATEKPLRRSPSDANGFEADEWPVLHPARPASPGTLQEMMRDTGAQLKRQSSSAQPERYPVLGNAVRHQRSDDQLPTSRYSAQLHSPPKVDTTPCEDSSLLEGREDEAVNGGANTGENTFIDNPFRDGGYNTDMAATSQKSKAESNRKAVSAPSKEKSTKDSKPLITPRQTRTSSLRARLATGSLVKTSQSKVTGFTDFTAPKDANVGTTQESKLKARKEARIRRSTTPPTTLNPKASRESISGNRAPAQFVAGSRRPSHPRRPSSRGSLRSESRAQTPPVPDRDAPAIPGGANTRDDGADSGADLNEVSTTKRVSSIPVPSKATSTAVSAYGSARDGYFVQDQKQDKDIPGQDRPLASIEESPRHGYHIKRLSVQAPQYGPTLKISTSADRFILGPNDDERQLNKKESKDNDRNPVKRQLRNRKSNPAISSTEEKPDRLPRPLSSQGLSKLGSRVGLIDPKTREKKVKSADLNLILPKPADNTNEALTLTPVPHDNSPSEAISRKLGQPSVTFTRPTSTSDSNANNEAEAPDVTEAISEPSSGNARKLAGVSDASKASTNASNDPFFDAHEQLADIYAEYNERDPTPSEGSWIAPLRVRSMKDSGSNQAATQDQPKTTKPVEIAKSTIGPTVSKDEDTQAATSKEEPAVKQSGNTAPEASDPFHDNSIIVHDFAHTAVKPKAKKQPSYMYIPATPQRVRGDNHGRSTDLDGHPMRSSSRNPPPEHTSGSKSPPSRLRAATVPPPTPPKDKLISPPKVKSPLGAPTNTTNRAIGTESLRKKEEKHSPQSIYQLSVKPTPYRDSNATDTLKPSGSKSVFSNLKGLFHKRSAESAIDAPSTVKPKKAKTMPKASVQSNGSPYPPPGSETYSLHRPTQASIARAKASTPLPSSGGRSNTPISAAPNHSHSSGGNPNASAPQRSTTIPILPSSSPAGPTISTSEASSPSTQLVMQILDSARAERSSPKKERLIELGKILVDAHSQAREAEKAMEEAKQAARKAEVANELCKRAVEEVGECVERWRRGNLGLE